MNESDVDRGRFAELADRIDAETDAATTAKLTSTLDRLLVERRQPDGDAWTCEDCGEAYEPHARDGAFCVWCAAATDPQLTTDGGVPIVTACPECDSADVDERPTFPRPIRWQCRADDCGAQFPEPVRRRSKTYLSNEELRADGGVALEERLDALTTIGDAPLRKGDTIEHVQLGPLEVVQRVQTGPETVRVRFRVVSSLSETPTLSVEYTTDELRDCWGETIHADPTVLYGSPGDDGGASA